MVFIVLFFRVYLLKQVSTEVRLPQASTLGAAAGTKVTEFLGDQWGDVLGQGGARAGGNLAGGLLEQRLTPDKYRDYRGVFASTVGSIVGDAITQPDVFRPMLNADARNFAETFAEQVAGQALLPDPSLADAVQTADASDVLGKDQLKVGILDAEQLWKLAALRRNLREQQRALSRVQRAGIPDAGLSLSPEAAAAQQEFRRMEIEQMNVAAGAGVGEVAGNGLTIRTSFPFPAEQLPEGGFFRGLVLGQSESSVLDAHRPGFSENLGAGVRGLVLAPINAVAGVVGEVGSQYSDLYSLVSGPKNFTPSSALYNSLQHEGIGGTLVNMGYSALSTPSQPVIDLLEGRYEQAGAGLPGMLSTGFGVVRGVRRGGSAATGNTAQSGSVLMNAGKGTGLLYDPDKLTRILAAAQKQGATVMQGQEAERLLKAIGAKAAYFPAEGGPGTFIFSSKPTRSEVLEELMHYGQYRKAGFPSSGTLEGQIQGLQFEVQAQQRLGDLADRLKWTPEEIAHFRSAEVTWKKLLDEATSRGQ